MVWDPQDYNGTTMVSFTEREVWTPNIVLANSNDDNEALHLGNDWMYVRYMHNGTAIWSPMAQFNSYCKPNVIKFPYDKQECGLNFVAWTHGPHEIAFQYQSTKVNMDFYHENGIWIINDGKIASWFAVIEGERRELLLIIFYLQRRANFFLLNLILPLTVMNILNVLVFILPPTSGDRVSYSITVLLAICVYMTIVTDKIPKTSSPGVSFMCTKCLVDMIISSFVVLFTIMGLRLYHTADDVVISKHTALVTKCILGLYCKEKTRIEDSDKVMEFQSSTDEKSFPMHTSGEGNNTTTWKHVGKASDIVFCIVCTFAFAMSDILFFAYVQ
ncbi:hypothetical protein FSP39_018316 [Pinctada imbricata]|uniref:Uncharacterized protein n=1 Tax=Pinctada imbricata TaxID=66713 RepID=A0AA88YF17_PINIB|nr:hypothetical protein FSP39_018316 [Pinctada imbricata]